MTVVIVPMVSAEKVTVGPEGGPISTYRNDRQHLTKTPPPVLKLAVIAASHPELIDEVEAESG